MSRNAQIALLARAVFVVAAVMAPTASPAADTGGPIHGVVVLSDQVEDVSSLEAIAARLTSLASGNAKAEEIFRLGAKFRHQSDPPTEYLGGGDHPHDPVKIMNVYGYCQCCCASAMLQALARSAGLPARGWSLAHHSVGEVQYDGGWHMYDLSLINFFRTDAGIVASVEDLIAQRDRLTNHEHSRYIDEKGFLPAHSQWIGPGSMGDYEVQDSKLYEYPYTLGHRATISLRAGESLVRRWGNRGLHVDQDQPHKWDPSMTQVGAKGNQAYLTEFYPGYQMGLVGNGELNYRPDLASESSRNLAWGAGGSSGPALRLAAAGKGEIVIPFSSGYVFLGGRLKARFFRRGQEAALRVLVSTNNGLDWKEIWSAGQTGSFEADIDLGPAIYRRYAYQLKIEMTGRAAGDAAVEMLSFTHDIQHSQRALPLLRSGRNEITVVARGPRLATTTLEGSLTPSNERNASYTDFHPAVAGLTGDAGLYLSGGPRGTLTFPVETPGEIRSVRFGGTFRARREEASIRLLVSDTGGRTWKEAGRLNGPFVGFTRFVTFDKLAAGTRRALVRYELNGPGTVGLFTFRVDVDYIDPKAWERPVKVTYEWTENGVAKTHDRLVTSFPTTYVIDVAGEPVMSSITVEGAPAPPHSGS